MFLGPNLSSGFSIGVSLVLGDEEGTSSIPNPRVGFGVSIQLLSTGLNASPSAITSLGSLLAEDARDDDGFGSSIQLLSTGLSASSSATLSLGSLLFEVREDGLGASIQLLSTALSALSSVITSLGSLPVEARGGGISSYPKPDPPVGLKFFFLIKKKVRGKIFM